MSVQVVREKDIVLTKYHWEKIECLRLAVEVLTGERFCLEGLDFNTGNGRISVGGKIREVHVSLFFEGYIKFSFVGEDAPHLYRAQFDFPGEIKVFDQMNPQKKDGKTVFMVGTSFSNRREEYLPDQN
jgi:hypothetical protein